jgi:hypothetical protein
MQYSAIFQEVAASFSTTVTTRAKVWVNAAYQEFLNSRKWSFLETTSGAIALVASQQTYVLLGTSPVVTDYSGMISAELELTSGQSRVPLREFDPQSYVICTSHSRVNGVPAFWATVGGTAQSTSAAVLAGGNQALSLYPIPVATAGNGVNVFIRYDRSAASVEMSADTDIPIIPVQYHYALVHGAASIGYQTYNQPDLAQQQRQIFLQRIQEAARDDMSMRARDIQRVQIVQQPFLTPQIGQPRPGDPPDNDPYPMAH